MVRSFYYQLAYQAEFKLCFQLVNVETTPCVLYANSEVRIYYMYVQLTFQNFKVFAEDSFLYETRTPVSL